MPAPSPALARLQGTFRLTGKATVAYAVPGEHPGENARRTWTFMPLCPAGACASVRLDRARASGIDTLTLSIRQPAYYVGSGIFYAPLRCGSRIYQRGEAVPFTITVRVTAASVVDGSVIATRVQASYMNRTRRNLTPCVAALGHDAAVYHGVVTAAPGRT